MPRARAEGGLSISQQTHDASCATEFQNIDQIRTTLSEKRRYMLEHPSMEQYIDNETCLCDNLTPADHQQETFPFMSDIEAKLRQYASVLESGASMTASILAGRNIQTLNQSSHQQVLDATKKLSAERQQYIVEWLEG